MYTKRFAALRPYIPGEQPKDRVYVKLNANENPYPPSPCVSQVLKEFDPNIFRLYPDPDSVDLRIEIAKMLGSGVTKDMIFTGNGSDEVLSLLFFTFFDSDEPLYFPEHTYSFYPVYAGFYNITYKKIPLENDFTIDTKPYLEGKSSGVIFANPNAPTGIFLSLEKIRTLLSAYPKDRAFVVDEAYIDFGGESVIPLLAEYPNLIVIRTFSKGFCFAGARLGYIVANPPVIQALLTTKNSFNHFPVDSLTQKIGIAACKDSVYYNKINAIICETRDEFAKNLRNAGWDVLPSSANFVFARKPGVSGSVIYEKAKQEGILIRYFNHAGITDYVRISIGLPQDMQRLLAVLIDPLFLK